MIESKCWPHTAWLQIWISFFIPSWFAMQWNNLSTQSRHEILHVGCVCVSEWDCVCMSVCVLNPRGRKHPGRRDGDWLSCWVLLTRVQFLHYVNTNRPVSHWLDGQHTHTHIYTTTRSNCNNHKPCRAISHPVLHIAVYSKPRSNKAVRETRAFSS